MPIVVKSTLDEQKVKDFFRYHLLKKGFGKYIFYALTGLFWAAGVIVYLWKSRMDLLIVFIVTGTAVFLSRYISVGIAIKKSLKNFRFSTIAYALTFSEKEITYQDQDARKSYPWDKILSVAETRRYFYFYIGSNTALTMMKAALSREQLQAVRDTVKIHGARLPVLKQKRG